MAREEGFFDDLARGLADGTLTRGKALRLMGAALVGGSLASLPGVAFAAPEGNSACDAFCHENFSGRQAGQCTRAGARGAGPCYSCTPGIGPGPHFTTPECGNNLVFNPNTCACPVPCSPAGICGFPFFQHGCEGDGGCFCTQQVEGGGFCGRDVLCLTLQPCAATADCPVGHVCGATCCGGGQPRCLAQCSTGTSGLAAARGAGPTASGR
jgi:CXCXC repeat